VVTDSINLINGDCLEEMCYINDNSVDLVLCDLPYGTTASNWDKEIPMKYLWEHYYRILKENGTILLFANGMSTPRVLASNIQDYKYRWVWIKNNSTNFVHAKNRPMTKSEDILVFSKGSMGHKSQLGDRRMTYNPQGLIPVNKIIKAGKGRFGTVAGVRPSHKDEFVREYTNYPSDVLTDFPEVPSGKKLHTNEKPVDLLEYLIKTYTNEGETVLDNCMGSGSTGVACVNTNRNFIGIELDEGYFEIAEKRIKEVRK
jgi:site-specific DNA-methyltransferase (adenine-specific)